MVPGFESCITYRFHSLECKIFQTASPPFLKEKSNAFIDPKSFSIFTIENHEQDISVPGTE